MTRTQQKIIQKLRGVQLLTTEYLNSLGTIKHVVVFKPTWKQKIQLLFGAEVVIDSAIKCENMKVIVERVVCDIQVKKYKE